MFIPRGLFILAILATGWWIYQNDQWAPLTTRLQTLVEQNTGYRLPMPWLPEPKRSVIASPPPAPTETTSPAAPVTIYTWADTNGVRQYGPASQAPSNATRVELRKETSMVDYEAAVQAELGVTAHQIEQARAQLAAAANDPGTTNGADTIARAAADMQGARQNAGDAAAQAYELMARYEQAMESIRRENNDN